MRDSAVLAALLERLVPADEHGPGAAGLGLPRYAEGALARAAPAAREACAASLEALEALARSRHGAGFAELGAAGQDALLAELEADAVAGFTPSAGAFFEQVRRLAIEGLLSDPRWGGNADEGGWRLIGYPGPRLEWDEAGQRIVAIEAP